jgi:hypothetical protein
MKPNFPVIDGKHIVLNCTIGKDNIQVTTETCPFCGRRHFHGTGRTDWGKRVWVVDGIRTLHHRVAHCVPRDVEITLADGTVVCNERGYYLGIGDQVPW